MSPVRKSLFIVSTLVVAWCLTFSAPTVEAAESQRPSYVVIITIDGCRPDRLQEADTPNIDNLLTAAAYSWSAQTVYPSKTPQAHASLFTGASPSVHKYSNPGDQVGAETMFQVFEEAGNRTALVDSKGGRIAGLEVGVTWVKNDVDYRWLGETEWQVGSDDPEGDLRAMENAISIFVENRPVLTFVLLPKVDTAGHIYGHTSDNYLGAIETADQAIGMLVDNLKALGVYENTLLVIVADHGMTGTTHGSSDPGDMTIPLILAGPGVEAGELSGVEIIDVAPTVSRLYGIRAPANAGGRDLFGIQQLPVTELALAAGVAIALVTAVFLLRRRRRAKPEEIPEAKFEEIPKEEPKPEPKPPEEKPEPKPDARPDEEPTPEPKPEASPAEEKIPPL